MVDCIRCNGLKPLYSSCLWFTCEKKVGDIGIKTGFFVYIYKWKNKIIWQFKSACDILAEAFEEKEEVYEFKTLCAYAVDVFHRFEQWSKYGWT